MIRYTSLNKPIQITREFKTKFWVKFIYYYRLVIYLKKNIDILYLID